MKLMSAISLRLKRILKERKLTQYQLSQISGVPESTISTIIKGEIKTVKLSTIYDICAGLNIEFTDFFEDKNLKLINLED